MRHDRRGGGWLGPFRAGAASALADAAATYTWRALVFGWLFRAVSQASLFGLLGKMLGPSQQRYLFVGAAVMMCGAEALMVCAWTVNERRAGVLSFVVASPSDPLPVLLGRGVHWLGGGLATSGFCLFVLGRAFGLRWTAGQAMVVAGMLVLTAVMTYCLGVALGALVLARPELRNVVGTVAASSLAVVCGVAVPLGEWPVAVRAVGTAVPLTHTLAAVRATADGAPVTTAAGSAALAGLWALVWLAVAHVVLRRLVAAGRRSGSIEFGGT